MPVLTTQEARAATPRPTTRRCSPGAERPNPADLPRGHRRPPKDCPCHPVRDSPSQTKRDSARGGPDQVAVLPTSRLTGLPSLTGVSCAGSGRDTWSPKWDDHQRGGQNQRATGGPRGGRFCHVAANHAKAVAQPAIPSTQAEKVSGHHPARRRANDTVRTASFRASGHVSTATSKASTQPPRTHPGAFPSASARRPDHRQDARPDGLGQCFPTFDNQGQIG